MTARRSLATLALLLFVLLPAACIPFGQRGPTGDQITVRVQNNATPPTSLTVYVLPEGGTPRLLGPVSPGSTQTFFFEPLPAATYRLQARTTAGREITSNPVTLTPSNMAIWDVQANAVSLAEVTR